MSISSEITRISGNVSDALTAIANKGVTVPSGSNSDDLADLIGQISTGSTEVITIEDTTDTAGGTIRTITAVDISDTTATASDVASGKYFYTASGVKTQGTGSGGGSNWTLLTTKNITLSTSSTTASDIDTINLTLSDYNDPQIILWIHIRDTEGKRAGYWYGHDAFVSNYSLADGSNNSFSIFGRVTYGVGSTGKYTGSASTYGIYPTKITYRSDDHVLTLSARYSSNYGIIDSTYKVDIYKLTMPTGLIMYEVAT